MPRKSPIRVGGCKPWPFPPRPGERRRPPMCRWLCLGPVRAAEFVNRRNPTLTAVVHPSTKERGRWQVSTFDAGVAVSDVRAASCTLALQAKSITPGTWRLKAVQ